MEREREVFPRNNSRVILFVYLMRLSCCFCRFFSLSLNLSLLSPTLPLLFSLIYFLSVNWTFLHAFFSLLLLLFRPQHFICLIYLRKHPRKCHLLLTHFLLLLLLLLWVTLGTHKPIELMQIHIHIVSSFLFNSWVRSFVRMRVRPIKHIHKPITHSHTEWERPKYTGKFSVK